MIIWLLSIVNALKLSPRLLILQIKLTKVSRDVRVSPTFYIRLLLQKLSVMRLVWDQLPFAQLYYMRVIADHIRTISFSITDGQLPSNAKAGYVIRRILRRAVRYGYTFLGQKQAFMYKLLPVLIGNMGGAYPELIAQKDLIEKVIKEEEDSFLRTLETGIRLLDKTMIANSICSIKRSPFTPLTWPILDRSQCLFPMIHSFLIHPMMHFLDEISHIFCIVAKEKEIDFIVNLEETEEEVWFSPSKLERILYNLLSNAFKYTQVGGCVELSAHLIKQDNGIFVEISVKDNGRGIPKEVQDKIFESYYQVEKRDHREGFGLGLSLTRSLIHMLFILMVEN